MIDQVRLQELRAEHDYTYPDYSQFGSVKRFCGKCNAEAPCEQSQILDRAIQAEAFERRYRENLRRTPAHVALRAPSQARRAVMSDISYEMKLREAGARLTIEASHRDVYMTVVRYDSQGHELKETIRFTADDVALVVAGLQAAGIPRPLG